MMFQIFELKMYNRTPIKELLIYLLLALTTVFIDFKLRNSKKFSDLEDYLNVKNLNCTLNLETKR